VREPERPATGIVNDGIRFFWTSFWKGSGSNVAPHS
jgi:hypothetical protein